MNTKKKVLTILGILISLILILFFIRLFSDRHLDDVHPLISCDENLLKKSDVYAVIPIYSNISISEDKKWCDNILKYNKRLILHGVYHTYNEFIEDRNQEYIDKGSLIFQECFNFFPTEFKPSQLAISRNNKILLKKNFVLHTMFTQIFHKVYHCNDTGKFSNRFNDWF